MISGNSENEVSISNQKRGWKTIGIIAACDIVEHILVAGLMLLFSYSAFKKNENTTVTHTGERIVE